MSTVHLLCGLNGAGKSTYARTLPAVRFSLDEWMLRLYSLPFDDPAYGPLAETVKLLIWDAAQPALARGEDVVLDWNSWSRARRAAWRGRIEAAGHRVVVHHIDLPMRASKSGPEVDPGVI
jgi:predicted kinase